MIIWRFPSKALNYASLTLGTGCALAVCTPGVTGWRPTLSMYCGAYSFLAHSNSHPFMWDLCSQPFYLPCLGKSHPQSMDPFGRTIRKVIARVHLPCLKALCRPCDHITPQSKPFCSVDDPLRWAQHGGWWNCCRSQTWLNETVRLIGLTPRMAGLKQRGVQCDMWVLHLGLSKGWPQNQVQIEV